MAQKESIYNIMSELKKIIKHRLFKQPEFLNDKEKLKKLLLDVNQMEINEVAFKIIRILIKFFRFPILILLKPFYHRIEKYQDKYLEQSHQDLQKTAAFAKAILKNKSMPSLYFYFKAGCDSMPIEELATQTNNPNLINFIEVIDQKMSSPHPTSEQLILKQIQENLLKYIKAPKAIMQTMCLQAYLQQVQSRLKQLLRQKEMQLTPYSYIKTQNSKIRIQNGKNAEKEIEDPQASSDYLCCRSYFYLNEIIEQPETLVQEYKNYSYPYDAQLGEILTKTICGFLNGKGGIIYIGIKEDLATKKRTVEGGRYPEAIKEKLLTYFRILCQKISPEIVNCQFYKIEFVPLKNPHIKNQWISGSFVIRVRVHRGNKNDLYSFRKENGEEFFAFRTENEVLTKKIGQDILEIYRQRLLSDETDEKSYLNHSGPCRPVQMGRQVFDTENHSTTVVLPWDKKTPKHSYSQRQRSDAKNLHSKELQSSKKGFFICKGKNIFKQLQEFSDQLINGWTVIRVQSQAEAEEVQMKIMKSSQEDYYRLASKVMKVKASDLTAATNALENAKILFAPESNYQLRFNSDKEVASAIQTLDRSKIDYQFIVSYKN